MIDAIDIDWFKILLRKHTFLFLQFESDTFLGRGRKKKGMKKGKDLEKEEQKRKVERYG